MHIVMPLRPVLFVPSMASLLPSRINIWLDYPFYMVSFLAGLQGISASLYEAAEDRRRKRPAPVSLYHAAAA